MPLMRGVGRILIEDGAVAQLGERRFCTPEVAGSIPVSSTMFSDMYEIPQVEEIQ